MLAVIIRLVNMSKLRANHVSQTRPGAGEPGNRYIVQAMKRLGLLRDAKKGIAVGHPGTKAVPGLCTERHEDAGGPPQWVPGVNKGGSFPFPPISHTRRSVPSSRQRQNIILDLFQVL